MVLKDRKVHLLPSYTLMQLVWCNHGMFERYIRIHCVVGMLGLYYSTNTR